MSDSPLRDRVDEMVCCVLDCGLGGQTLDAYIFEFAPEVIAEGLVPDADARGAELRQQHAAMDPQSREHFAETYAEIEASIRNWEASR